MLFEVESFQVQTLMGGEGDLPLRPAPCGCGAPPAHGRGHPRDIGLPEDAAACLPGLATLPPGLERRGPGFLSTGCQTRAGSWLARLPPWHPQSQPSAEASVSAARLSVSTARLHEKTQRRAGPKKNVSCLEYSGHTRGTSPHRDTTLSPKPYAL